MYSTKWLSMTARQQKTKEIKAIFAISINNWKVYLFAYPLSFITYFLSPLVYLLPALLYAEAITGNLQSESLMTATGIESVVLFITLGVASLFLALRIYWITAFGIRREEWNGTLEAIYITPLSRYSLIAGASLYALEFSVLSLALQLVAVFILYNTGINPFNIFPVVIAIFLTYLIIQGFCMFLSGITIHQKQAWRLVLFIDSTFSLVAPATFPLALLFSMDGQIELIVTALVAISPFTWIIEGFREAVLYGFSSYFLECVVSMIIAAIVWFAIGVKSFSYLEQKTRKAGSLGKY